MNNYIINPAVFYWINVFDTLKTICGVIGGLLLAGFLVLFVLWAYKKWDLRPEPRKPENNEDRYAMRDYQREMDDYQQDLGCIVTLRKYMLMTMIIGGLLVTISIFIPGKQTSIEMLIARTATFDNVDWTVQQVKEVVDYIVNALKGTI